MASAVAAVETRDLAKRFERVEALRGVSLRIEPGEIFALLGPNGAGKTTWISIVCGLTRPTGGTALVLGHDVTRDPMTTRRAIGLVPQEVSFDPFFSPREILGFQMGYQGLRTDDRRIDELLAALDLTAKADTNTRELSGGMKRRLLIAKALVHRPKVAFLDEPTAGVDVALRRDLWSYVRKLRDEGTTIVLTTHYLEEAEALADRVAVIDKGRLISLDTPAALLAEQGRKRLLVTLAAPLSVPLPPALAGAGAVLSAERTVVDCPVPRPRRSPAGAANGASDGGAGEGTAQDDGALATLLAAAASLPGVLDVRTEQPSLEQVFLRLTEGEAEPEERRESWEQQLSEDPDLASGGSAP